MAVERIAPVRACADDTVRIIVCLDDTFAHHPSAIEDRRLVEVTITDRHLGGVYARHSSQVAKRRGASSSALCYGVHDFKMFNTKSHQIGISGR